jgi:hypothetical protein
MILIAFLILAGSSFVWRGLSGKLLVFRFTPRGLRGLRLETTRSCRISSSTLLWNALLPRGEAADEAGSCCPGVVTPVGALVQKMRTWAGKEGDRSQKGLNHQPHEALPSDSQSGRHPALLPLGSASHVPTRWVHLKIAHSPAATLLASKVPVILGLLL